MTTYYVRPTNGNNGNAGTSFGAAFQTIHKAFETVTTNDIILLCAEATEITSTPILLAGNINGIKVFAVSPIDGSHNNDYRYTIQASSAINSGLFNTLNGLNISFTRVDFDANYLAANCWNESDDNCSPMFIDCNFLKASGTSFIKGKGSSNVETFVGVNFIDTLGTFDLGARTTNRGGINAYFTTFNKKIQSNESNENMFVNCRFNAYTLPYITRDTAIPNKFINCLFIGSSGQGIFSNAGGDRTTVINCTFYNCNGDGIYLGTNDDQLICVNTTFINCSGYGIRMIDEDGVYAIQNCHAYNCSGTLTNTNQEKWSGNISGVPLISEYYAPLPGSPLITGGLSGTKIGAVDPYVPTGGILGGRVGNTLYILRA